MKITDTSEWISSYTEQIAKHPRVISQVAGIWHDKHISAIHQWLKTGTKEHFEWMEFCEAVESSLRKKWDEIFAKTPTNLKP